MALYSSEDVRFKPLGTGIITSGGPFQRVSDPLSLSSHQTALDTIAEASAGAAKEAAGVAVESGAEARGRLEAERRRSAALEAEKAAAEERLAASAAREQVRHR